MDEEAIPDRDALRDQVRDKYRAAASNPGHAFGFHTGRALAARLGYDADLTCALGDAANGSGGRLRPATA
ncbi:MAG TPA: hypothetical protein VFV73_41080 [Streptosporangiaceae bacterium]|nr:hypothetical protein [Streptosporangiaceae bacterium]